MNNTRNIIHVIFVICMATTSTTRCEIHIWQTAWKSDLYPPPFPLPLLMFNTESSMISYTTNHYNEINYFLCLLQVIHMYIQLHSCQDVFYHHSYKKWKKKRSHWQSNVFLNKERERKKGRWVGSVLRLPTADSINKGKITTAVYYLTTICFTASFIHLLTGLQVHHAPDIQLNYNSQSRCQQVFKHSVLKTHRVLAQNSSWKFNDKINYNSHWLTSGDKK